MVRTESIIKIAPALLAAQKKIGPAVKTGKNPFFHSNYSTLGDVMEACKEILNEHGIVVLQPVGVGNSGSYVETVLLHESGEYISDRMMLAVKSPNDPQALGSAISYARRYSLQSMCFIPSSDDDAESATPREENVSMPKIEPTQSIRDCGLHDEVMYPAISKNTGKPYFFHKTGNGKMCFGN